MRKHAAWISAARVHIHPPITGTILWDSTETLGDFPVAAQNPSFEWHEVHRPGIASLRAGCGSCSKNQALNILCRYLEVAMRVLLVYS